MAWRQRDGRLVLSLRVSLASARAAIPIEAGKTGRMKRVRIVAPQKLPIRLTQPDT